MVVQSNAIQEPFMAFCNVRFADHHILGDWSIVAIAAEAKAVTRILHVCPKFLGRPIDLPPEG
jgi:hypothetical protein